MLVILLITCGSVVCFLWKIILVKFVVLFIHSLFYKLTTEDELLSPRLSTGLQGNGSAAPTRHWVVRRNLGHPQDRRIHLSHFLEELLPLGQFRVLHKHGGVESKWLHGGQAAEIGNRRLFYCQWGLNQSFLNGIRIVIVVCSPHIFCDFGFLIH
jgi:hypothetical protein